MTDIRWAQVLVALSLVGAAVALSVAVVLPGPRAVGTPGPGFGPGPVTPSVGVTAEWREIQGLEPGIVADSNNSCQAGRIECLDVVIGEMQARFDRAPCAHTAPFAFTYLETTRGVRQAVAEPDFFHDPPFVSQLDGLFARLYFDAFDNWTAGRRDHVPAAWQIAFQAAEEGRTSAAADVFLGMNAHISRDLAYAVAEVVGAQPDLLEDPTDYLLINEVIASVQEPLLVGASARFDPSLDELASLIPSEAGVTSVELIAQWRQQSLDLGRQLAEAGSPEAAMSVAAEIERTAVAGAVLILNADSSLPVEDSPLDRDSYCEARL